MRTRMEKAQPLCAKIAVTRLLQTLKSTCLASGKVCAGLWKLGGVNQEKIITRVGVTLTGKQRRGGYLAWSGIAAWVFPAGNCRLSGGDL